MKAYLYLRNGDCYEGISVGSAGTAVGEVIFSTGMVGYQEELTDPAMCGVLLCKTYPLAGNVGVNPENVQSDRVWPAGYIVREVCDVPSNFRCAGLFDDYLRANGVVGIADIDTRRLTRTLRDQGAMPGAITTEPARRDELMKALAAWQETACVARVTRTAAETFAPEGEKRCRIACIDLGLRRSLLRALTSRGAEVVAFPASACAEEILAAVPDGVFVSGGPGMPDAPAAVETLRALTAQKLPTFGVCLGHLLLAQAHGARTVKLPHGHYGANHPVKDLASGRTLITTQAHSYAVDGDALPAGVQITYTSMNDGTVEGLRYGDACCSVQFYPEATTGAGALLDQFVAMTAERSAH